MFTVTGNKKYSFTFQVLRYLSKTYCEISSMYNLNPPPPLSLSLSLSLSLYIYIYICIN